MTLLQNHQYDGPDPCTLPLTWWFGVAPLELEDVLPTVTSKASRWSRKAAGGGSGGGSGGGTAPMGSASGGHPYHPAAHDDADPWANWVGLAERAPLMREAVGLARRVGRPHEDLEVLVMGSVWVHVLETEMVVFSSLQLIGGGSKMGHGSFSAGNGGLLGCCVV